MNPSRTFFFGTSAVILFLCISVFLANAQLNPPKHRGEQTSFSIECDFEHPVPVNGAAKEALATSPRLARKLKQKHLEPKDLPDRWFVASRVRLGDGGRVGLVVMGVDGLLGANITSFWVLRRTGKGYDLVLDTIAAALDILETKTDGLQDIETYFPGSIAYAGSQEFRFDGQRYQVTKRTSQTIGAKVPRDLAGYETHAPFVQPADDDTAAVLAQARTWIWHHWKDGKPFYVTVVTQNGDGDQATYELYTSDDSDEPGLIVKVHKTHWEQESPSGPRRKITDDDLWVASDVERVYPAIDDQHDPQIIPEQKDVAASVYRLNFRDGIFSLATL